MPCRQHVLLLVRLQEPLPGVGLLPGRRRNLLQGSLQLLPAGLPRLQHQGWDLLSDQEQPAEREGLEAHPGHAEHGMNSSGDGGV